MADYVIDLPATGRNEYLVPNINQCRQKDSSSEVRHKAYASR